MISGVTPTRARDNAIDLARRDWNAALVIARGIRDPWYACQAMAFVARWAPDEQVVAIAHEALARCRLSDDAFQRVAAAAWPVSALVRRGCNDEVIRVIDGCLESALEIENIASRSEALFQLFQAVFPIGGDLQCRDFEALMKASNAPVHWRQARNARDAILMMWRTDRSIAEAGLEKITRSQAQRQIRSRLAARKYALPRTFC